MFDRVFRFGMTFDWFVGPGVQLARRLAYGRVHTFWIVDGGLSGRGVARLLRKNGVKAWTSLVVGGVSTVGVRRQQAERAQLILDRHGVATDTPFVSSLSSAKRARGRGGYTWFGRYLPNRRPSTRASRLWRLLEKGGRQ